MKLNYFKSISLLFTFLFCVANPARAALITTEFSELVGNQGTVDINLSLASGENLSGFSLYFSETLFANLDIIFSPAAWDSIVVQPDTLLGAGLFDSYNPAGLSSGVARVSFTYLSDLPFQTLAYDFYDADFPSLNQVRPPMSLLPCLSLRRLFCCCSVLIAVALRQSTKRQQVAA